MRYLLILLFIALSFSVVAQNEEPSQKTLHGIYIGVGYSHLAHKFTPNFQSSFSQNNYKITNSSGIRFELGLASEIPINKYLFFNNYLGLNRVTQSFTIHNSDREVFKYNSLTGLGLTEFLGFGIKILDKLRLSALAGLNLGFIRKTTISSCWYCGEESYESAINLTNDNLDIYSGAGLDIPLKKSKIGVSYFYNWINVKDKMRSTIPPSQFNKLTEHLFTFKITIWLN